MVPSPIRVAVVGTGIMGARHAKCVAAHAGARLAAVVDIDRARCDALAAEFGCTAYRSADDLLGQIDAAIIAVPTAFHADVATPLLAAGVSCLVEKPFVSNMAEGTRVTAAAKARGATLQVGHIERFNPAVTALLDRIPNPAAIRAITARRISAASARVKDIDVVIDLMVHDIDIAIALKRQPVTHVTASGDADHAEAVLTFGDGTTATLTASRTLPGRIRDLHVTLDTGMLEMDYIARTLAETKTGNAPSRIPVAETDALTTQLDAFFAAMKGCAVTVSAGAAMEVMNVAWRIQATLGLVL